jgi:hypothetical protein
MMEWSPRFNPLTAPLSCSNISYNVFPIRLLTPVHSLPWSMPEYRVILCRRLPSRDHVLCPQILEAKRVLGATPPPSNQYQDLFPLPSQRNTHDDELLTAAVGGRIFLSFKLCQYGSRKETGKRPSAQLNSQITPAM